MSAASLQMSVHFIPIPKPTSAYLRAGASSDPLPVKATVLLLVLKPDTRRYLSCGLAQPMTFRCGIYLLNSSMFFIISLLVPGVSMPST